MRPPLQSNLEDLKQEVHAWALNPSAISPEQLRTRCFDWLSPDEQQAWNKRATPALRHAYLAARALCRATLSRYIPVHPEDWRFEKSTHGKPYVVEPAEGRMLSFNLTHTRDLVVCAVSDGRALGVDAEEIQPDFDVDEIAGQFFSENDRHRLAHVSGEMRVARFFETWVLKESYLKACGVGLMRDPGEFTIPTPGEDGSCRFDGWQLQVHRPSANHIAAVAVAFEGRDIPIRWQWAELPVASSA
jgi:4'-phosphopantetheinyl transferase